MNDASASSGSPADASSIKEKAQDATGQAQEKARDAAGQVQDTLRRELDERTSQAGARASGTAEDIRSIGEELRKQGKDGPGKLADKAAEQTEKVGSYLSGNGPDQMLHDLEDFGRRRPWALLAGGLLAGAAAARFLKASSRSRYEDRSRDSGAPSRPLGAEGAARPHAVPSPSPSANGGAVGHSTAPDATLPSTPEPAAAPGVVR
ncbi:MAG TPA: hypothetical protein VN733_00740 [Solirubrobacterales bacterium]|nr:hypothetical protein [Solirubrobacterales bacterium]